MRVAFLNKFILCARVRVCPRAHERYGFSAFLLFYDIVCVLVGKKTLEPSADDISSMIGEKKVKVKRYFNERYYYAHVCVYFLVLLLVPRCSARKPHVGGRREGELEVF